jgi:hypothetical protein
LLRARDDLNVLFEKAPYVAAPRPVVGWRRTIQRIVRPTESHGGTVGLAAISRGSAPAYSFRFRELENFAGVTLMEHGRLQPLMPEAESPPRLMGITAKTSPRTNSALTSG